MTSHPSSYILSPMTVNDYLRDFIAGILPASLFSCKEISVPEYTIPSSEGDGAGAEAREEVREVRIIQISDLHSNDFGGKDGILVRQVRDARPDLIFMTGDIFDKDMGPEKAFSNVKSCMEGIDGLCPIYYVLGNHELFIDEKPFLDALASYGARVLTDEAVLTTVQGRPLVIAGLADPMRDLSLRQRKKKDKDDKDAYRRRLALLAQKAAALKSESAVDAGTGRACRSILLAHRPEYIADYAACGFDFIFSGHAHGGQWIVPGLGNGLYAVGQGFFPKYAGGMYEVPQGGNSVRFIVSRGLSYQKPSFPRFGNPPELPLVRLC